QLRGLRRMKLGAGALLLLAVTIYALATRWRASGGPAWAGYVAAAAEAGTIGGLADWFAVTALFRRPLGLPIPHTAILPTRKAELGRQLQRFVATNFLSEAVIRDKIARFGVTARFATWLGQREHAARLTGELATMLRGAVTVLRDDDVQRMIENAIVGLAKSQPIGPTAGRLLAAVTSQGSHQRLLDIAIDKAQDWLGRNREVVLRIVSEQAPSWSPRFVDRRIANRVYKEVLRFLTEVRSDPSHQLRRTLDDYLATLALDLQHDPVTMAAAERLKGRLLGHPELRRVVAALWSAAKRLILDAAADPSSELRQGVEDALLTLAARLRDDDALRVKIDNWVENALTHVITTYRDDVTAVISDTVDRWDAKEATRKIELQVGRDLQYIRINGTVVGALAGVVIHALSVPLL
ncbi:MAG: DUF445 domain-containing protein, partial [Actinomycetota bacterium]|nr:DUF445 domain-containing protein [Actinomycetota bacterium]